MKPIESNDIIISITDKGTLISLSEPANESAIIYIENSNLSKVMKQLFDAYYENN